MGIISSLKDWDMYGQPVQFNYRGKGEYTTVPGALISIITRIVVLIYFTFKMSLLVFDGDWSLMTQTIATNESDLEKIVTFQANSNFSLGIELVQFKTDLTNNRSEYLNGTNTISRYT